MSTPHDALFRFTFGDPRHAGPLLAQLLPPAVAAAIDWASLAAVDDVDIDSEQGERRRDLLFSALLAEWAEAMRTILFAPSGQEVIDALFPTPCGRRASTATACAAWSKTNSELPK